MGCNVGRHNTGLMKILLAPFGNLSYIAIVVILYVLQVVVVISPTLNHLYQVSSYLAFGNNVKLPVTKLGQIIQLRNIIQKYSIFVL